MCKGWGGGGLKITVASIILLNILNGSQNSGITNLRNIFGLGSYALSEAEFMVISTRQKFLAENCSEINIHLDGHPICRVEHAKSLGLMIDDRLSWSNHVKELCRKISSAIGALRRIRSLISQYTAVQIYNALIQPHFDYCKNCKTERLGLFCKPNMRQTQACFLKL